MRSNRWRSSLRQISGRRSRTNLPISRTSLSTAPSPILAQGCARTYSTKAGDVTQTAKHDKEAARSPIRVQVKRQAQSSSGVPAPPPLPDWFLKYNVKLRKAKPAEGGDPEGVQRALVLEDPYNDKPILTIPFLQRSIAQQQESEEHKDGEPASSAAVEQEPVLPEVLHRPDSAWWAQLQAQLLTHAILTTATASDTTRSPHHVVVYSANATAHDEVDAFVDTLADGINADVVRIDPSDIAELAGDYVDSRQQATGTISSLAYDAYHGQKATHSHQGDKVDAEPPADQLGEDSDDMDLPPGPSLNDRIPGLAEGLSQSKQKISQRLQDILGDGLVGIGIPFQGFAQQHGTASPQDKSNADEVEELDRWQRLKLKSFFDHLLLASHQARDKDFGAVPDNFARKKFADMANKLNHPDRRREFFDAPQDRQQAIAERFTPRHADQDAHLNIVHHVNTAFGNDKPAAIKVKDWAQDPSQTLRGSSPATILHVRDIHLLWETPHGEEIVNLLCNAVLQRQKDKEQIVIVGTSAGSSADVATSFESLDAGEDDLDQMFIQLRHPDSAAPRRKGSHMQPLYPVMPGYGRLLEINLRSVQSMITSLGIKSSPNLFSEVTRSFLYAPGTQLLGERMLDVNTIQKIVLTAEGFRSLYTTSEELDMTHLAVALTVIDASKRPVQSSRPQPHERGQGQPEVLDFRQFAPNTPRPQRRGSAAGDKKRVNLDELRQFASRHEQKLFGGIVDPANIKTSYDDIHVAPETIDALKTVTTLALLRPEAFRYGVLAKDRLPGLLLYGPPGTGKTLLAKAVAKDASATVLEVSGAQVYEKYVGEGEKMVKAVFSLAKRLSPCVVFIDEADALFGSRGGSGNRTTHREIINQFLREWDGMDDHGVFMMVATNRPFDLDDAVLRRLPRRILVDLPLAKDREAILRIHLGGELLADDVSLAALAEQTPFYSGSDLKNVCVAAALAAVKAENELQLRHGKDDGFALPERRTLTGKHFELATQEISASISEDMRSLDAIKKFDEQYGDRKGRRKRTNYGFGDGPSKEDERAARVRGDRERGGP